MNNRSFASPDQFWNRDSAHKDRKFYVAFCLLESTLSDYAIARDLHFHNKLNWACTIYYYSLFHALRLICFIAKGDFPIRHTELTKPFKGETCKGKWLSNFLSHSQNSGVNLAETDFSLQDIVSALSSETATEVEHKLRRWGDILDKARDLRNDSNYEGLIMAHEYAHLLVTEDLRSLAELLMNAAEEILPGVIGFFKNFVDQQDRKDYWYAFLNYREGGEGLCYLEDMLKYKLLGRGTHWALPESEIERSATCFDINSGEEIIRYVHQWVCPLRLSAINNVFAEEVRDNIRLGIFNEKRSLMKRFGNKIRSLRQIIEGNAHG